MEITQNKTRTTNAPNINPSLMVPKRRFRLPHLSPKSLFVSLLVLLFLLVLGLTVVVAVKNTFKKTFPPSLSNQPTLTPEKPATNPTSLPNIKTTPQVQVPQNSLPPVCQQNYQSPECSQIFNELVKKNCGFDLSYQKTEYCVGNKCNTNGQPEKNPEVQRAIACADNYYRQLGEIACGQDSSSIDCQCSKVSQPLDCLLNKLVDIEAGKISKNLSNLHLTILCPMKEAFAQTLGFGPFDKIDCRGDYPGKQTTTQPSQANSPYFGLTCSQNPNQEGCLDYCYQRPDELGCSLFLANHCAEDFGDPICMDIICTYAPNLCGLCGQFPTACEQALQRYLGR